MKVLREPRRRHLLRPRAVIIDDRRRSSIKTQKEHYRAADKSIKLSFKTYRTMINYSIVKRSVIVNLIEINQAKSRINQAKKGGKTPQPANLAQFLLLHEHEVDGGNEAEEGCKVVPVQTLTLEENVGNDGEDDEGYAFLYHLELNQ